jgi:hypothetical protein
MYQADLPIFRREQIHGDNRQDHRGKGRTEGSGQLAGHLKPEISIARLFDPHHSPALHDRKSTAPP